MKHIMGNTPKCYECYFYKDKEQGDYCRYDGWCYHPKQCKYGINGRIRREAQSRIPVRRGSECRWWEDAEDRISHFDVMTGGKNNNEILQP